MFAFTYADEDLAREVAAAPGVTLSLTEPRSTGAAFRPLVIVGTPRLVEDPSGDAFAAYLLPQELRRYPPSRLLADSPLLQREHWWYLPRLLVEIDVDTVAQVVTREDPARDHLLVVAGAGGPIVRDLEQWTQWSYGGRWDGAGLQVEEAPVQVGLGRPPGLLQRWRRQRDFERRCLAAIPRPVRGGGR